jgi:ZIP family zinc transporter
MGVFEGGKVSLAMLVAVFISNLPESIAGSSGMKAGGWGKWKIFSLWLIIGLVCAGASLAGYLMFEHTSDHWLSFINAFAGGAILVMITNSMTPEAHEHGGKLAGIFTVLGFSMAVSIVLLEQAVGR